MIRYVIKRLLLIIPIIIAVSFLIFVIINMAPGSALSYLTPEGATPEEVAEIAHKYGFDKPVVQRYFEYMIGLAHGDLGVSYISGLDVFDTYMSKLPATLALAGASILVAILLAIPIGIYAAIHNGSLQDNVSMVFALIGVSMPTFWLGLLFIILFSNKLGLLPSGGFDAGIKSIILPALTLGLSLMAVITRTTRSSMLDVLRQDYLLTARAKGVGEKTVVRKHALKNAMIPILTVIGTQLATVMGGSLLVETVFAWPGCGRLLIDALNNRDTPMLTGCIIIKTILISLMLLIVDLLYAAVDPRVKAQYAKGGKR